MSDEHLITLAQAARELPGGPVHVSTLHRWRLSGIRGVKLETLMRGGRRMTSPEAIGRFISRTTAVANGEPVPVRTPTQRARDVEAAERELDTI